MSDRYQRWARLGLLVVGLILYLAILQTLVRTQNPNFVPALILLGATVVPLAFPTSTRARAGRWQVPAATVVVAAFFGGVGACPANCARWMITAMRLQLLQDSDTWKRPRKRGR